MPTLGETRQPVAGDWLPSGRIRHELPVRGSNAWIGVKSSEPDADHFRIVRIPAPERRAAGGAEELREAVWRLVGTNEVFALRDPEGPRDDATRDRRGGARAPLAAGAVAVAGRKEWLGDLEADTAAQAPSGERKIEHAFESTLQRIVGARRDGLYAAEMRR